MAKLKEVRFGIVGTGNIGRHHLGYLTRGEVANGRITAVAEADAASLKKALEVNPKVATFATAKEMYRSGLIDAVIIATPHYSHPELTVEAFKAGLHVMCEKPMAVTAQAAQRMIDAHAKNKKLVFSVMFMMRLMPVWKRVKELIDDGTIGEISRVECTATNWFRTQAYYDSGGWRATWEGEGGGVLLNQCPHHIDLLTWFAGMPSRVMAQVGLGKHHRIEVEDEVVAILNFSNGAIGTFVTTTHETPGTLRFEIAGDKGKIVTDGKIIELHQSLMATSVLSKTSRAMFVETPAHKSLIEVAGKDPTHAGLTTNFVNAILFGEKLVVPGEEAIWSLELANGIIQSGLTNRAIELPTNHKAYEKLLAKLIKTSKFKKVVDKNVKQDIKVSFRSADVKV